MSTLQPVQLPTSTALLSVIAPDGRGRMTARAWVAAPARQVGELTGQASTPFQRQTHDNLQRLLDLPGPIRLVPASGVLVS